MGTNAIELFAGAGGMGLGLRRAGWAVYGVERDPLAAKAHNHNVGPCEVADAKRWHPAWRATLVAGGAPCQSFSPAGHKRGLADPRGKLWRELLRVAVESKARAVLLENTSGMRAMGCDATVERAFTKAGYGHLSAAVLDACDYGVPQFRARLFIVGFRDAAAAGRFTWPRPTHGDPQSREVQRAELQPWVTVREALGLGYGQFIAGGKARKGRGYNGMRRTDVDRPYWTVNTRNNGEWIVPARGRAWRLKLRELAVLQGFPQGFEFFGTVAEKNRQMGNALPPPVGEALGRALRRALE